MCVSSFTDSILSFPIDVVDENGQVVDSPLAQTLRGPLPSNKLQVIHLKLPYRNIMKEVTGNTAPSLYVLSIGPS